MLVFVCWCCIARDDLLAAEGDPTAVGLGTHPLDPHEFLRATGNFGALSISSTRRRNGLRAERPMRRLMDGAWHTGFVVPSIKGRTTLMGFFGVGGYAAR